MEQLDECCVPPGFRFHPTEEELVGYYLARKVASQSIDLDIIQEVDLYRMEPWDLQRILTKQQQQQQSDEQWYFFSHKDRKYPSGTRTNRATAAGFWKATGRDKPVLSSSGSGRSRIIGMRKTLVFYKGRAPNGRKTDWIMHEYRLLHSSDDDDHLLIMPPSHSHQEEGWVVCRAFRKPIPNQQQQVISRPSTSLLPYHHPMIPSSCSTGYGGFFSGSTSLPLFYPPETRGEILLSQQPCSAANHHAAEADDLLFHESNRNNKQHLLLSMPQLIDSPIAAVDDDELQQQQGGGGGQTAAGAIDWNFLDTLLLSSTALHDPASSSASSSLQLQ